MRGLEYKIRNVIQSLYRALVTPYLEYCKWFWIPHLRKDVLPLETYPKENNPRMIGLMYDKRLKAQGLYSLEFRRTREGG